jgi:hypothetical protein
VTEVPARQRLSDADVREILLAPAEVTNAVLGERFSIDARTAGRYRRRKLYRAIRIAQELEIIDRETARAQQALDGRPE